MISELQKHAFPMIPDIQKGYGLSSTPDLSKGRRTFDVCYVLSNVFDKSYYRNSKSYNDKVGRYLSYKEKNEMQIRLIETEDEIKAAEELYREWNEVKLEADRLNPNHYAEHSQRYWNCLEYTVHGELPNTEVIGLFDKEGQLMSYYVCTKQDSWVYIQATACTKKSFSRMANVATVNFLRYYLDKGFEYCDYGETGGDQNLLKYKEMYPNFRIYFGEPKLELRQSTEEDVDRVVNFMFQNSTEEVQFPTEYMPESIKAGNVKLAFMDEELVGMVEVRKIDVLTNLMTNLIVSPEFRCQGIATTLMDNIERPFKWFCLKTNERANNFYRKIEGAKVIGDFVDSSGKENWNFRIDA